MNVHVNQYIFIVCHQGWNLYEAYDDFINKQLVVLFFANVISGTLAVILLVLSAILILTSVISFCPLYWPFNISTGKKAV